MHAKGKGDTAEGIGELDGKVTAGAVNLTLLLMMRTVMNDAICLFACSMRSCVTELAWQNNAV